MSEDSNVVQSTTLSSAFAGNGDNIKHQRRRLEFIETTHLPSGLCCRVDVEGVNAQHELATVLRDRVRSSNYPRLLYVVIVSDQKLHRYSARC